LSKALEVVTAADLDGAALPLSCEHLHA